MWLAGFSALLLLFALPSVALALGPNAVRYPTGWNTNYEARGDDVTTPTVALPFTMNWGGTSYNTIYINMNGNCTFGSSYIPAYDPNVALSATGKDIMAPFWADVDTNNAASGLLYYSNTTTSGCCYVDGHKAFLVTWNGVARYNAQASPLNYFQLVIIDRSDTGAGNFDFEYNYDQMTWDRGTAASTYYARAGWGKATAPTGGYELPGTNTSGAYLDTGPNALIKGSLNSNGQLGRYVWQVRAGSSPNMPPTISVVNRVLEGNASGGYNNYNPSLDASATDVDGTVWTFVNDCPASLPLGNTVVTWTATDSGGATAVATETVTVADTLAPTLPTLASSSHTTGVWSTNPTVALTGLGVTDICSGLSGFSYLWSAGAAATPDTVTEAVTTAAVSVTTTSAVSRTTTVPVDLDYFPNSSWPTSFTVSDLTAERVQYTRAHAGYAAEIYTPTNNTRKTANFYQDYDLSNLSTATVSFWEYIPTLAGGSDYEKAEYSTDGGTTWTTLDNQTAAVTTWTQRTYALPTGGMVRVRFSGSVNGSTEYIDFDDIAITGFRTASTVLSSTATTTSMSGSYSPGDGIWYYNVRDVDASGNWSGTTSLGPFKIDSTKPVTTSNAPSTWVTASPTAVTLTATDTLSGVAYTRYKLDASAIATYTATSTVSVSGDGTHTLLFWSADNAGNVESTKTATIRIDSTAPSVPTSVGASALSTTSIQVSWQNATDTVSGIAYYAVYRDGSLVGTVTAGPYTDSGLSPGSTHTYYVVAYNGALTPSTNSATASASTPQAAIWMSLSTDTVDMGAMSPGAASTVTSATTVKVGGIGGLTYDFWCSGVDFSNSTTGSITPTMTIGALSYVTNGYITAAAQPFSATPYKLDTAVGSPFVWEHDYRFDYILNVPWVFDPGTYTTTVTYTVVQQ